MPEMTFFSDTAPSKSDEIGIFELRVVLFGAVVRFKGGIRGGEVRGGGGGGGNRSFYFIQSIRGPFSRRFCVDISKEVFQNRCSYNLDFFVAVKSKRGRVIRERGKKESQEYQVTRDADTLKDRPLSEPQFKKYNNNAPLNPASTVANSLLIILRTRSSISRLLQAISSSRTGWRMSFLVAQTAEGDSWEIFEARAWTDSRRMAGEGYRALMKLRDWSSLAEKRRFKS